MAPPGNGNGDEQDVLSGSGVKIPPLYIRDGVSTSGFNPPPPQRLWVYVVGSTGTGKTCLAASIPRCVICSFEAKTSNVPRLAEGSLVVGEPTFELETGRQLTAPWRLEEYLDFWNLLVNEAHAGRKFFDVIAFDTVGGLCDLVLDWFTETYQDAASLQKNPGMDFTKYGVEGSGYKSMNSWIIRNLHRLRAAGYGALIIGHRDFTVKEVKRGERSENRLEVKHDCNPGVHKWLARKVEYAGIMELVPRPQVRTVRKELKGKTIELQQTVGHEWKYILNVETQPDRPESASDFIRQHVMMDGTIELPEGHGWDTIVQSYMKACERKKQELAQ